MAMNLWLRPEAEAEAALRAGANRANRSHQDLIRDAVDQYLGLYVGRRGRRESNRSVASLDGPLDGPFEGSGAARSVKPARGPLRYASRLIELPEGVTSLDLLDRDDRL
jgi:hypothetical protein